MIIYSFILVTFINMGKFNYVQAHFGKKEEKGCEERKRKEKKIEGIEHCTGLQSKDREVSKMILLVRGKFCCQVTIWTRKYKSWNCNRQQEKYSEGFPFLKIGQYLRLHMKIICWIFYIKHLLLFEVSAREICEKFVYKYSETIEYVEVSLIFKKFTNFTCKWLKNYQDWECQISRVLFLYENKHVGRFSILH